MNHTIVEKASRLIVKVASQAKDRYVPQKKKVENFIRVCAILDRYHSAEGLEKVEIHVFPDDEFCMVSIFTFDIVLQDLKTDSLLEAFVLSDEVSFSAANEELTKTDFKIRGMWKKNEC